MLLYVSLFAILCSAISIFTIQTFTYIATIHNKTNKFEISYYVTKLIEYHSARSEEVLLAPIGGKSDSLVFKNKEKGITIKIDLSGIRRITRTISDIESVWFSEYQVADSKIIEVFYMIADNPCSKNKTQSFKTNCVERIIINLI